MNIYNIHIYIYIYMYWYIYICIYVYVEALGYPVTLRPNLYIWVVGRSAAPQRGVAGHSPAIIRFWQFWSNLMIGNRSFIFQNRILENREFQFQSDGPCPVSSTYKDLYVNVHTDYHHWPVRGDDPSNTTLIISRCCTNSSLDLNENWIPSGKGETIVRTIVE